MVRYIEPPEQYDKPDPAILFRAAMAQKAGARVTMAGTVLSIAYPDLRPVEVQNAEALAIAADGRWARSQACEWRGLTVPCDQGAGLNVLAKIVAIKLLGAPEPVTWKIGAAFVKLSLADLEDLGLTMQAHVQACFDDEAKAAEAIASAKDAQALEAL